MNVREALESLTEKQDQQDRIGVVYSSSTKFVDINFLVPIIERALRAAYDGGYAQAIHPDDGIAAGVAAMMEET